MQGRFIFSMRYSKLLRNLKTELQLSLLVVLIVQVTLAFQIGLSRRGSKDPDGALQLSSTVVLEEMGARTRKTLKQCTTPFQDNEYQHGRFMPNNMFKDNRKEPMISTTRRETAQERIHRIRSGKLTEGEKHAFIKIALTYGRRSRQQQQQRTKLERPANATTCSAMDFEMRSKDIRRSTELLQAQDLSDIELSSISRVVTPNNADVIVLQSLLSNLKSLAKRSDQRIPQSRKANLTMLSSNKTTMTMLHYNEPTLTKNHPIETTKQRIIRIRNGRMTNEEKDDYLIAIATSGNIQLNVNVNRQRRTAWTETKAVCDGRCKEINQETDGGTHQSFSHRVTDDRQDTTLVSDSKVDEKVRSSKIATRTADIKAENFSRREIKSTINPVSNWVKSFQAMVVDSKSRTTKVQPKHKRFSHHWANEYRPSCTSFQDIPPSAVNKAKCSRSQCGDSLHLSSPEHMSSIHVRLMPSDDKVTTQRTHGPIRMMLPFQNHESWNE